MPARRHHVFASHIHAVLASAGGQGMHAATLAAEGRRACPAQADAGRRGNDSKDEEHLSGVDQESDRSARSRLGLALLLALAFRDLLQLGGLLQLTHARNGTPDREGLRLPDRSGRGQRHRLFHGNVDQK